MKITNEDNMDLMARYEDNHFDLAIVDPPYGIGNIIRHSRGGNQKADNFHFDDGRDMNWNNSIPSIDYFNELIRISKNQIIWGGNYYSSLLKDSRCWIVWDKNNGGSSFSDAELAYTSFDKTVSIYKFTWHGMIQGDMKNKEKRIHPTQKPVQLYEWLLMNYANKGNPLINDFYILRSYRILDTHLGSGSIAIACHNLGFDLTACELDPDYYKSAMKRLKEHQSQIRMF